MAPAWCCCSPDRCFSKNENQGEKNQSRKEANEREVFLFSLLSHRVTFSSHRGQAFSVRAHLGANCKYTLAFTTCKHCSVHTSRSVGICSYTYDSFCLSALLNPSSWNVNLVKNVTKETVDLSGRCAHFACVHTGSVLHSSPLCEPLCQSSESKPSHWIKTWLHMVDWFEFK